MFSVRIAIAMTALAALVGCSTPIDQYKPKTGAESTTVSISDEGLSFWKDVPVDDARIPNSNVFVSGAAKSFFLAGGVLVDNTSAGNARISKQIPPEFGVAIAPILKQSMQRSAEALKARLDISDIHAEATELHMKPLVRLNHVGSGRFNVIPKVKVEFLDADNKRQFRTYLYDSRLTLPLAGDSPNWTANNLQLYRQYLSTAYDALAKTVLLDQQGAFRSRLMATEPTVVGQTQDGLSTIKQVLVGEFDKVRVTHPMVASAKNAYFFRVEDLRSPAELLEH